MRDPDQFDAFYADSRERLLLQTFALTGDLPAAKNAVRDAYVIAWHHWRKANGAGDPEAWTRPHAWAHAQRRHTTRPWHREKNLPDDARATLDALGKLSTDQRRVLLLTLLASGTVADHAREVGITREEAERQLQTATAQLAMARDVPAAEIRTLLTPLAAVVSGVRLPGPELLRRAGSRRRRTHTAAGVLVTVAAVVVSGVLVTDNGGVNPSLETADLTETGGSDESAPPVDPPHLEEANLLTAEQVAARIPDSTWTVAGTDDNTAGDGLVVPCQSSRYADPRAQATLARTFAATPTGSGRRRAPARSAVQLAESSATDRAAERAFRTAEGWFAGCTEERFQLISTHRVTGVGDRATVVLLRDWNKPVTSVLAGVTRTGRLTTTVVTTVESDRGGDPRVAARLLGTAVTDLCALPEAGACTTPGPPQVRAIAPLPTGTVPAMLSAIDLPPATSVNRPWVGTEPRRARDNFAATPCDDATFRGAGWSNNLTRTFLIPGARLPTQFGITETVGSLSERRARRFVDQIRTRMSRCSDRDLGSDVVQVAQRGGRNTDLSVWQVTTEISDEQSIRYLMALVRTGTSVAQVGFIPSGRVQIPERDFVALAERALERLKQLPAPRR